MLCIISPYAAVYAHGAHRVGRHGARGKHLRHSCDLWAWWCCLRCYCWLGCQWRDGRRPLAPLQQRLLRRGKIRNSCPEPADTWPHICIYTTSVWAAQAKPRSSQLATVWLLAVVSHSWCTSSQQGRLITIVTRREKSSICEIPSLSAHFDDARKINSWNPVPVCSEAEPTLSGPHVAGYPSGSHGDTGRLPQAASGCRGPVRWAGATAR